MYIKVVTVKIKPKHKRAKKVYQYVKVIKRVFDTKLWKRTDSVVATLGTVEDVHPHIDTLCRGLQHLGQE